MIEKLESTVHETFKSSNPFSAIHVVVLMGGLSEEREISLKTSKSVIQALKEMDYTVSPIDMGRDIASILLKMKPNVIFNALHGIYGEDGCVPGMLEILGIPYTHSGVLASSLGLMKTKALEIFQAHGIKTPKRVVVKSTDNIKTDPIRRPYVVKPISQGSSIGLFPVFENDPFNIGEYNFPHGTIMIEEFIDGQEIEVGILNDKAIGTVGIFLKDGRKIFDFDAKYTDGVTEYIVPARLSPEETKKVMELAEKAHKALECKCLSRVGFMYKKSEGIENGFYILEVNTHPGITPTSLFPKICKHAGIEFNEMIKIILDDALNK